MSVHMLFPENFPDILFSVCLMTSQPATPIFHGFVVVQKFHVYFYRYRIYFSRARRV